MAIYQGSIPTGCTGTKITASSSGIVINLIIINNSANYDITVSIYRKSLNSTVPLYSFELDAGDSVRDTQTYTLSEGDYIQLISNISGTTYYISTT